MQASHPSAKPAGAPGPARVGVAPRGGDPQCHPHPHQGLDAFLQVLQLFIDAVRGAKHQAVGEDPAEELHGPEPGLDEQQREAEQLHVLWGQGGQWVPGNPASSRPLPAGPPLPPHCDPLPAWAEGSPGLPGLPLREGATFLEKGKPLFLGWAEGAAYGSLLGLVLARGGWDGFREAEGSLGVLDRISLSLRDVRSLLGEGTPARV